MPKKENDQLAEAVILLSDTIKELIEQRQIEFDWLKSHAGLATKQDLKETEATLLKAFGERVDPIAVEKLSQASDALEKAVEANVS
jgi:hypothetical protein